MAAANGIFDEYMEMESREDQFVTYVELPTLQEMACWQVTLSIWYSYISRSKRDDHQKQTKCDNDDVLTGAFDITEGYWEDLIKMVEGLGTPRPIEEKLETTLNLAVHHEMYAWVEHFRDDIFSWSFKQYCISHFNATWCVWLPNGTICYKRSAAKMLRDSELNAVQKFIIMCAFCLKDEIETFSLTSLPKVFVEDICFRPYYLTYYWIRYLRNELNEIPLAEFDSVDVAMAAQCRNEHWTAFEYFWNRLGTDDQVLVAVHRFTSRLQYRCKERLFGMMSGYQQDLVFGVMSSEETIFEFWLHLNSPKLAVWAWNRLKYVVSAELFARVLEKQFYNLANTNEAMCALLEIWDAASDEQRDYVANRPYRIIESFNCQHYASPAAIQFMCKFLSLQSADFRKTMIMDYEADFGYRLNYPSSMIEIVNLCLPDPADQLEFKKSVFSSDVFKDWYEFHLQEGGDFRTLDPKIDFFSPDANAAREFRKNLLVYVEHGGWWYVRDYNKWHDLSEFVDKAFSDDVTLAVNWKKRFVTRNTASIDDHLGDTKKVMELVLADEELK